MDFVAIDFETANPSRASICQVGIVSFRDGQVADEWETLVDPRDYFSPWNIRIHGITPDRVGSAPTYPQVHPDIHRLLHGRIAVSHTNFDCAALSQAAACHGLVPVECDWLDSAEVARRVWPSEFGGRYGLANVACYLGIRYRAHDAREDARACGQVVCCALAETGLDLPAFVQRLRQGRVSPANHSQPVCDPAGALRDRVLVFTGTLSISRDYAAHLAGLAGARVGQSVTRETTMLVVGDRDPRQIEERSAKRRRAEELITKGQLIEIIGESDFLRLARG